MLVSQCVVGHAYLHADLHIVGGMCVGDTGTEVNMPLMKWDQLFKRWVKLDAVKVRHFACTCIEGSAALTHLHIYPTDAGGWCR